MIRRTSLLWLAALLLVTASTRSAAEAPSRPLILVGLGTNPSWRDMAYLAAIPAASHLSDREPAVIGLPISGEVGREVADYLQRYKPTESLAVGVQPADVNYVEIECRSAASAAIGLATHAWKQSTTAVVCDEDDYGAALLASSLAALVDAPLLYSAESALSTEASAAMNKLGVRHVLSVGKAVLESPGKGRRLTAIPGTAAAVEWARKQEMTVDYYAVANPEDRDETIIQKLSLVAPLFCSARKGLVVPLSSGKPEEVQARLTTLWELRGSPPTYLCIVGHPDAVPFWKYKDGPKTESFVASDVPYADADEDSFFEIAVGRIVAEDALFATLHASRVCTYPHLADPLWSRSVGFARWEDSLGPQFANVGFETQYFHSKHDRPSSKDAKGRTRYTASLRATSPLRNVAAFVHGSHSSAAGLGETYSWDSKTLLSPCVVESAGCGTTGLHADKKFRSVISRMFRNGAVAFHGNAVPSPAPHQELRYAFWNAVLAGQSIGAAHMRALNCKMITVLENGQLERGGIDRRTLIMRHLYGDPAFRMTIPRSHVATPAHTEVSRKALTLHGPESWYTVQIRVPEDWKEWHDKPLYVIRAPGIYLRAQWCGEKYDIEEIYAAASFTTRRKVTNIEQVETPPKPLGWSGKYFEDINSDGTRTYRWRVRMADFNQKTGTIEATVDTLTYRIAY